MTYESSLTPHDDWLVKNCNMARTIGYIWEKVEFDDNCESQKDEQNE